MTDDETDPPSLEPPRLGALDRFFGRASEPSPPAEPSADRDARPLFADEVAATATSTSPPAAAPSPERAAREHPLDDDQVDPDHQADEPDPGEPREPREPLVTGMLAAVLVGAVTGLMLVLLTAAGFAFCEGVKGTSSCGGPGLLLLLAIMGASVYAGALLLRLCQVPDAGSTSFLGAGLMSVFTLLFLVDDIFAWWMAIALPVLGMAFFALAHWVTARFALED